MEDCTIITTLHVRVACQPDTGLVRTWLDQIPQRKGVPSRSLLAARQRDNWYSRAKARSRLLGQNS